MIGLRIKKARIDRHISQAELAEKCGWSQSRVGNYERKIRKPSVDDLISIAKALQVNVQWLASGEGEREVGAVLPAIGSPKSQKLAAEVVTLSDNNALSDEQIEAIRNMIGTMVKK